MKNLPEVPDLRLDSLNERGLEGCRNILAKTGVVCLNLAFPDPDSRTLQALASTIGCPHSHSTSGDILWDVSPLVAPGEGARSHTTLPFPLHTDCSFEDPTPRYVGLHVLTQDRFGGGQSLLAEAPGAVERLENWQKEALTQDFLFQVPEEFRKGVPTRKLPILVEERIRYRREIINEELCSREQVETLNRFEDLLTQQTIKFTLRENSILLLDNWRFLHGRTEVLDPARHLRRIRFHQKSGL